LIVAPLTSLAVATTVWGELGVTVADGAPLMARLMLAGGQVEKYPAADVVSDVVALITVEPGRFAVAIPLGFAVVVVVVPVTGLVFVGAVVLLMVTTLAVTGLKVMVPTLAFGLVQEMVLGLHSVTPPGPVTVVSDSRDIVAPDESARVCPWETHFVWLGMVIAVMGGWMKIGTGLLVMPAPVAVTCTVPHEVEVQPEKDESEEPAGGVQMEKSAIPPGLLRFQVPAQMVPAGEMSASSRLELA
jgi:hypothetical protein